MLSFVNNMVIRMVSNGCFILLAAISLLAMPSKADVWTRIAEKIAKEQNPGAGSKAGIATRLEKLSEIEEFGLWKIEQRKRNLHLSVRFSGERLWSICAIQRLNACSRYGTKRSSENQK